MIYILSSLYLRLQVEGTGRTAMAANVELTNVINMVVTMCFFILQFYS